MASYYFQEDSSDESLPSPHNPTLDPLLEVAEEERSEDSQQHDQGEQQQDPDRNQSQDQHQHQLPHQHQNLHNPTPSSPASVSASSSSLSISLQDTELSPPIQYSENSSPTSRTSAVTKDQHGQSPNQLTADIMDERIGHGQHLKEDARSLAVVIEDQFLLTRSDLEESLLKNLYGSVNSLESKNVSVLYASSDKHLPWTTREQQQQQDLAMMRFVPQTRVFYINKQYRTVFLVDVSSSVLTVDTGGSKIVMGQVTETLTKCLAGLAEKFSCPGLEMDFVQTEIHVTVIAECSQFASNVHTGEMLSNFPTMKVLLQDIVLTQENLHGVLKMLRVQLAKFQAKLSKFRGQLRRTRESLGYSLAVEDAVEDENLNLELDFEDDISRRKSWGVGLSGANLSYTLTAGLFALDLMPQSASPSLVVVTDGVVKSNLLHGSTILRRLMELDVSCSIIQLGNKDGSIPSCNWGFIQDTEALRFVAEATLGKFMFSQECASVDPHLKDKKPTEERAAPNMYHRTFLIRELCLLKPRPGLDDTEDKDDAAGYSMANFPWDPKSQAEPIKMMQTACKDYHLNIPVEMLVAARIRQGFRIKGVSIAPDRDRPSSERYLITMTLTWLPNVTVQYKLKGQVDGENKSNNFLHRFEPPKVEIDIIAYQAFAIHFLNSQHASVSANHSVYAKVFRIHRYIVGLSDSDVTLRGLNNSHASANQALLTQRTKSMERSRSVGNSMSPLDRDREEIALYLSRLSEQWSGLARDADRQYSRCWYNEFEFDGHMIIPPPAFLPTSMDTKNTLVKYSEGLEAVVAGIRDFLKTSWASFVVGNVFVQTQQQPESSSTSTTSARFCELRLFSESNVAVLRIQLRFFGVPLMERRAIVEDIQRRIFSIEALKPTEGNGAKSEPHAVQTRIMKCERPIYRLLMRHLIHEAPLSHTPEATSVDFHTHVAEPIGEESVLRSYLVHKHWVWKDQVRDSIYLSENGFMASQDLAFQYLCAQRIGEGFLLASALPNRVVLCKEIGIPSQDGSLLRCTCTIQYLIFRSPVSGELVTELWAEPFLDLGRHSTFDKIKSSIIAVDRFLISRLATFEAIHTIGRLRLRPAVGPQSDRGFMYPWLFDPATLLRQQRLITLAYEAPKRRKLISDEQDISAKSYRKCTHTLGLTTQTATDLPTSTLMVSSSRDLLLTRNSNTSTTSLSQSLLDAEMALVENDLVAEYKDQIRELSCADRDLAILHLFMEKSLSQLAEGEIMAGNEDDACSQLFLDIKTSIKRNPEVRRSLMTFHCASSFDDIRCFVKIPNSRFFRLIIIPKLGSVISHISKMRSLQSKEGEARVELARHDFLSCLMFECLRSKPLGDVGEHNANALDQSLALFELHPVSLGPVVQQQPLLLQPIMNEDQGRATKVHESTLQLIRAISQAYSHSYAKAIFAALVEGHSVETVDLQKAMQICTRSSVDINITGFLNTLELGRRNGLTSTAESSELTMRFMQVLQHSFEQTAVSGPGQTFFYRPVSRRASPKLAKSKTRKRSPSVSRQGSIDVDDVLAEVIECAERPLFMHLECSFQKPLTQAAELERKGWKSSVTFPVSSLPLSYNYKEKGSREHNYAPSSIGFESRPVDSADGTMAMLHLVVSTLPMPDDYIGPTLKSIDSESKISLEGGQLQGSAPRNLQHVFPTLDSTQLEAISDTEARLEWLVKEEVMHGLLSMTPVTVDILSLVETQLKTKSNFVNFPTSITLPLTFVKKRRGHEIFMQELGRTSMLPYELCQVGPYFYLREGGGDRSSSPSGRQRSASANHTGTSAQDARSSHHTRSESSNSLSLPTSDAAEDEASKVPPSSDLCHGLGIVILQNPNSGEEIVNDKSADDTNVQRSERQRDFWLILVPKESYVQVHFFSKTLSEESCHALVDHVRKAVDELCIKVNQLTLLQSLNETRNCSKYLVPADDSDPNIESGSSSDSDQVSQEDEALVTGGSRSENGSQESRKFRPGEFACPLVYRVAWPLHWRVKPGQAMKSVAHMVLYPFAVQNRKNFFVVESQDDHDESKKVVVFLRLSEVDIQPGAETAPASEDSQGLSLSTSKTEGPSIVSASTSQTLEDPGSHSNSPRPSPTASPGSRNVAPTTVRSDSRELVIEVYGVQAPGRQVTSELFSLLESKFYNSVVLGAMSTFLSRNATLKLTQADVDFILPVDRLQPVKQILDIPRFINAPFAFLMYLKQNLGLYLHPLTSTDKVGVLTRHYQSQFGRLSTADRFHDRQSQQIQIGDFTFFYNAVQGRSQTPIESSVGIGVAGVCLTVLGQDGQPVFEVGYQDGDPDHKEIQKYFDSCPDSTTQQVSKYNLLVEIWAQGTVSATALLDVIGQSFRQSLCDDIMESSIAQGLCTNAQDRRNDMDETDGEPLIGECVQKNFIDPSFLILQHSFQWKNPAVHSLKLEYSMPPWIMDSFLLELDEILTDVSVSFSPLLIRSMADSHRYKVHKASSGSKKTFGDMTNIRFILVGGIQDLSDGSSSSYYGRRTSMGNDRSHSRRSSFAEGVSLQHSHKTSTHSSQHLPKRQLEDIKMYPNAITSSGQDETMLTRNCFVVITANGFGLQAYTYNWGKAYQEMFNAIERVVKWHQDRMRLLDNVLLQKMGLFHHVPSILPPQAAQTPALSTAGTTPSLPRPGPGPQSSPHLGSNLRMGHSDNPGSAVNVPKPLSSPKSSVTAIVLSDTTCLSNLVDDQFPNRTRSFISNSPCGHEETRSEPQKASSGAMSLAARPSPPTGAGSGSVVTMPQSHPNSPAASSAIATGLDIDQILRDYVLEPLEKTRDEDGIQDEVQRHAKPFLDTFMFHTKNAEDQQNAYNVYQKWSRRYKDRKGSPNALHENMNTSDLAIMLRSARLLHFCRTPLLFTEFSSSLYPLVDQSIVSSDAGTNPQATGTADSTLRDLSQTDPVVQWYSSLAETFMREYSQYLATVGMQLLMYGNSKFDKPVEPSHSDELSFMSQFTVSNSLSVSSPAAFLFKSLQGGSIMCEVRLQGMFVCVTLYTLNRRYGRVKVAAPGFATAEANKHSLRVYTEQCARFKDRIHVNSFVYDFHLRYIHRILVESSKLSTGTSPTSLPFSFDLLDVLHQFLQYHSRPAAYARNRVYRGVYRTNLPPGEGELPGHLFEYVVKNPQRYGFQAIHLQNRPRACFVSGRNLLEGFGGLQHYISGSKPGHTTGPNEVDGATPKGFGVGGNRGGLPTIYGQKPTAPHLRHTSHDSSLNAKRSHRRLPSSRSSYNVKETPILEDEGVEYVLVLSDGEQDNLGLTVHYYLLILREEEVVKKLEEAHGPLLKAKDRLLAANHSLVMTSGSIGSDHGPISPLRERGVFPPQSNYTSAEDKNRLPQSSGSTRPTDDVPSAETDVPRAALDSGKRLMDAMELQERITERAVLGDVVRAAEIRLDLLLKQAAQFFDRDSLWEMLLQGKIGNSGVILTGSNSSLIATNANTPSLSSAATSTVETPESGTAAKNETVTSGTSELGFADFLALGQRFHSTPLEEMEPDFRALITAPGIDWSEVLSFLGSYYARWAREFMEYDETNSPGPAVSSLRPGLSEQGRSSGSTTGRGGSVGPQSKAAPGKGDLARRHLVIFNPHNRDLLVHFVINMNTASYVPKDSSTPKSIFATQTPTNRTRNMMRTSTGDLYSRFNRQVPNRPKLQSQSHSQLQSLLQSPSQSSSPRPELPQQYSSQSAVQPPIRPSLSEVSSRVSSVTSIARAASLAVSKVASRFQSSRSRDSSSIYNIGGRGAPLSETSSRAPSIMDEDTRSIQTRGSIRTTPQTPGWSGLQSPVYTRNRGQNEDIQSLASNEASEEETQSLDRSFRDDEEAEDADDREDGVSQDGDGEGEDCDNLSANVRVFSVSREPKSGYNAIESEHVGDIIRTISYWVWRAQKRTE
ncbi:KICSTOR complex protein szt2 [Gryganskiella cystojenkinii]|nr:KICSTOR complex protein szt2 [Gryganskiella cystojenkinii]